LNFRTAPGKFLSVSELSVNHKSRFDPIYNTKAGRGIWFDPRARLQLVLLFKCLGLEFIYLI